MLGNAKALIVVLVLAGATLHLCRPICLHFMTAETFARRRNCWFALTLVAFLSPNFWVYAIFAAGLLVWASGRDENPLALYVMVTFTAPDVHLWIPVPLVNQLFDLTQYRILSLAILVPAIWRSNRAGAIRHRSLGIGDLLLIAFLLLQVVLLVPYESMTNTMRRTFLFAIDAFIVFYAFGRLVERERIADVMASFWVAAMIMAPIAIFESLRGWLLYTGVSAGWGDPNVFSYLMRGSALRAQVAAGHSILLGYQLSIGLGFYLYLRQRGVKPLLNAGIVLALALAIIVSYSRGAWVTAVLIGMVFVLLRPQAGRRLAGPLLFCALGVAAMYASPLKESVLDRLPFIGAADQDTVEYRRQLAETSWLLIKQNPFFGDPFVFLRLESLRQGQGIIDIVNGYIFTALFTGLVGLTLLIGVFANALVRAFRAFARVRASDPDAAHMGIALVACFVGTLVFIATASYATTSYILCGLLVSYAAAFSARALPAASSLAAGSAWPRTAGRPAPP